jgi:hypothetical protein
LAKPTGNPNGRPRYNPTDKDRATVKALAGYGITQPKIARVLGIHDETLRDKFRDELDTAETEANAQVAQSLFQMATKGKNVAAAIFWLKTRAGWRDVTTLANADGQPFIVGVITGVARAGD